MKGNITNVNSSWTSAVLLPSSNFVGDFTVRLALSPTGSCSAVYCPSINPAQPILDGVTDLYFETIVTVTAVNDAPLLATGTPSTLAEKSVP